LSASTAKSPVAHSDRNSDFLLAHSLGVLKSLQT
jgi:hypothetical protein